MQCVVCHPSLPLMAIARGHEIRVLHVRCNRSIAAAALQQPVDSLRWAPTDRTILLAVDGQGSISILVQLGDCQTLHCATRFHSPAALRAVEWLTSLPMGFEGFVSVSGEGALVLCWRRTFGAELADETYASAGKGHLVSDAAACGWRRTEGLLSEAEHGVQCATLCTYTAGSFTAGSFTAGSTRDRSLMVATTSITSAGIVVLERVQLPSSTAALMGTAARLQTAVLCHVVPGAPVTHMALRLADSPAVGAVPMGAVMGVNATATALVRLWVLTTALDPALTTALDPALPTAAGACSDDAAVVRRRDGRCVEDAAVQLWTGRMSAMMSADDVTTCKSAVMSADDVTTCTAAAAAPPQQNLPNKILFVENLPVEVTGEHAHRRRW